MKISKTPLYNALSLDERLTTALPEKKGESGNSYRLKKWQTLLAPGNLLEAKLTDLKIEFEEFAYLVDESAEQLVDRIGDSFSLPTYLETLMKDNSEEQFLHFDQLPLTEFCQIFEPLYYDDFAKLYHFIDRFMKDYEAILSPNNIKRMLLMPFWGQLNNIVARVCILELNILRLKGQLKGSTPEERYTYFMSLMQTPGMLIDLLQRYPVLARQVLGMSKNYVRHTMEMIDHLGQDWDKIWSTLLPNKRPGRLIGLSGGVGDSHNEGRSVCILTFEGNHRIVYKPRNLDVDMHFQELLRWFNARYDKVHFYEIEVINRANYGWVEFIPYTECKNEEELKHFYESQGAYLAILHLLEAADFHSENIIAHGKYPVLIDMEALFHPRFEGMKESEEYNMPVFDAWLYSVLRTGILPVTMLTHHNEPGLDLSGLGTPKGQLTPMAVPQIAAGGTDELRVVRKRIEMSQSSNQPILDGKPVDVVQHIESVVNGFSGMYRFMIGLKTELLLDGGPLFLFRQDRVRAIIRATRTYVNLLNESFHPDVLRNALDRDLLFDRLWFNTVNQRYMASCVHLEQRALHKRDVPAFYTTPMSTDLEDTTGAIIPNIFPRPSFEIVLERCRMLSETDLEQQVSFIRGAITTLSTEFHTLHEQRVPGRPNQVKATSEALMSAATAIADRLELLAIQDDTTASWIGLTFNNEHSAVLQPLQTDLYSGLPGIVLFLVYLDKCSGATHYAKLVEKTLRSVDIILRQKGNDIRFIGAYSGLGSLVYTYTHLASLFKDEVYITMALNIIKLISRNVSLDEHLDLINGSAGCIMALATLYRLSGDASIEEVMIRCADHLVSKSVRTADGVGWVTPGFGSSPLAGISHGATGFALALAQVAEFSGNPDYKDIALQALSYERSLYSPQLGNWLDMREFGDVPQIETPLVAWCHGAVGIGLGRMMMWKDFPDERERFLSELEIAIDTTLKTPFASANHSLCHGSLGNLELIMEARRFFKSSRFDVPIDQISGVILDSIQRNGWLSGGPGSLEIPGLMIGLAGIGYGLLRLAYPEKVPSILMLESPRLDETRS